MVKTLEKVENNQKYFDYLNVLKGSGVNSCYESVLYLSTKFSLSNEEANNIVGEWIRNTQIKNGTCSIHIGY